MSTAIQTPDAQTQPIQQPQKIDAVDALAAATAIVAASEVSRNWKWLMAGGIITAIAGCWALFTPVVATGVVGLFIGVSFLVVGCVNMCGVFFRPKGMKLDSLLVGIVQVLVAAVMAVYPFSSLAAITILAASLIIFEGTVRTLFALATRDVEGWGWGLFSGLISLTLGITILLGMPYDALYVIGILVGANMLSNGVTQMGIAWQGRKIARALADK